MTLGPLMIDLQGTEACHEELCRLRDPRVGGLILFSRNFESIGQLERLVAQVRGARSEILIAVDHEGGRVQRFRKGFTRIPAMHRLGELYDLAPEEAITAARWIAFLLASELRQCGVDLSFTPVLDIDWGRSAVIGDRSFHGTPEVVSELGTALTNGLHEAGMAACGKHFPGHGWAEADSHHAIPIDDRTLGELQADIAPFRRVPIDAVMPAHVIYSKVDSLPAGFSTRWQSYLRHDMAFAGAVFSDDLSMAAAGVAGGILERVEAAWHAGCDMLLLCNAPDKVDEVLQRWDPAFHSSRAARVARLRRGVAPHPDRAAMQADVRWQEGKAICLRLGLTESPA